MFTTNEVTELQKNDLYKTIYQNNFTVFINALKSSGLPEGFTIRKMFGHLQSKPSFKIALRIFLGRPLSEDIDKELKKLAQDLKIENTELMYPFMSFCKLYLDEEIQKQNFPDIQSVLIQTISREIFHNYLNPLPQFIFGKINSNTICPNDRNNNNDCLSNLSKEIQKIIYFHLDAKAKFSLGRTCKQHYFFQKENYPANILYIADPGFEKMLTKNGKKIKGFTGETIIHQKEKLKAFFSLYAAIEYLHRLGEDNDYKSFIPSLWAVVYAGNIETSERKSKIIKANCGKNAIVSYMEIQPDTFIPLLGTVLLPKSDFAKYKIFNQVNYIEELSKGAVCTYSNVS